MLLVQLGHLLLELLARRQVLVQLLKCAHLGLVGLLLLVFVVADLLKQGFILAPELVLLVL